MAVTITNGYCSLAEIRAQLHVADATDTADDAVLGQRVEAISRSIDFITGRRFYTTSEDETRYYTSEGTDLFKCPDDIISITTLKTDDDGDRTYETTWTTADYDLEPYNAVLEGKPYLKLRVPPQGSYAFPTLHKGIEIVGKFGYSATTPPLIKATCLLAAQRLFARRDTPMGIGGGGSMGQVMHIMKEDPDVADALALYMRDIMG